MGVVAQTFWTKFHPIWKPWLKPLKTITGELAYQFAHKMKPNIEMFGIDLLKQITGIESWTKTSKNINSIQTMVDEVNATLHEVFEQLKSDFNL